MGAVTQWWRARRSKRAREASVPLPVDAEFGSVFQNAAVGMTVIDNVGRFLRTNSAFERFLGYGVGELLGVSAEKVSYPEDWPADVVLFQQCLRQERTCYQVDKRYVRKDGALVWGRLFAAVVRHDDQNAAPYCIGMVEEITEQRRIEEQLDSARRLRALEECKLLETNLRQAQKMQALGTLAGGIAHDFNNILLAISGNTKLATQDLPADHPAQLSLAEISKASARASSVVNQILAFSRREDAVHALVDLRTILEESLSLMRAALSLQVSIRMHIGPARPLVLGDPAQIQQVLLNLATNAAHSMGEVGGTLDIELEEVDSSDASLHQASLSPGSYHRIAVRDTGSGMPAELIERIFEPFFTTKPRGQGTGLGLSVVHGIVKAHGGVIAVASKIGSGSVFRVYLPAVEAEIPVASAPAPSPARGQGQHILYLDDEESLVHLITRVLERLGYRVSGFTDARTALSMFRLQPALYDSVVTDQSMPGMSGAEFARQVLLIRPQLPVIMTSGFLLPEDRQLALQAGVRELLLKPNTVEELGEVLHRLLHATSAEHAAGSDHAAATGSKIT